MYLAPRGRDIFVPIAFLPWPELSVDLGASLTLSEVLLLFLLPKYIPSIEFRRAPKASMYLLTAFAISIGGAVVTLGTIRDVPLFEGGGFRNGWGRVLTVAVMAGVSFIPWVLITRFANRIDAARLMRVYIYSCLALALLGLLQLIAWHTTGVDLFPIGMFGGGDRTGLMKIGAEQQLRVSSLGGEPKGFSMSLTIAVLLLFFGKEIGIQKVHRAALVAFFLLMIALSAATSALLTLPIALALVFGFSRLHSPLLRRHVFAALLVIGFGAFFAYYEYVTYNSLEQLIVPAPKDFMDALWQRSIGRIQLDDFDHVIMDSFLADPRSTIFGRGLGLVHYYAYQFIPDSFAYYMKGRIIPPKSGITFLVSNAGLVGTFFFLAFIASQIPARYPRLSREQSAFLLRTQAISISLVLVLMLRFYVWESALAMIPAISVFAARYVGQMAPAQQYRSRVALRPSPARAVYPQRMPG